MKPDPLLELAQRLRSLRETGWPGLKVTQFRLSEALELSVPLISSWESRTRPQIPPVSRLEAYATFFATRRSLTGDRPRLLEPAELTEEETVRREELRRELLSLRSAALGRMAGHSDYPTPLTPAIDTIGGGPWHFRDARPITLVCAQLPGELLARMPYAEPEDPDYVELYTYSDLDALFELHGHVRAVNPASQVDLRVAQRLAPDDYTGHLVLLGGVDWNRATRNVLKELRLPVRQLASPSAHFEVDEGTGRREYRPVLEEFEGGERLKEDVALFYRGPNPYNRKRTLTICNGLYGRGTYGAVRALTDARFRDRNAEYLETRFPDVQRFSVLTRVEVMDVALTPDWTLPETILHEWSEAPS